MMRRFPADTTDNGNSARIGAPSSFDSESFGNRSHPRAGKSCLQLLFAVAGLRRSQGRLPETESQLATIHMLPPIWPRLNPAFRACPQVTDMELLDLVEMEVRELLTQHGFPGDTTPVVR